MQNEATVEPGRLVEPRPAFVRRASNVMLLGAVVSLLAVVLLLSVGQAVPPAPFAAALALVVTTGVTMLLLSFALDRGRPWAPTAAVIVLWIAVIGGIAGALLALTQSSIRVPLDTILALWALSAHDRPRSLAFTAGRWQVWAIVAVILVAEAVTPLSMIGAALLG